jgi:hypothetical protein
MNFAAPSREEYSVVEDLQLGVPVASPSPSFRVGMQCWMMRYCS